jgi:hypothetical protein
MSDVRSGSKQNYEFMKNTGIEVFIKYNYFRKK